MSDKNNQGDMSLSFIVLGILLLFGLVWAASAYSEYILKLWKALRLVELAISFQWTLLTQLWNAEIVTYDARFDFVNERIWSIYKWLAIPMGYFAWKAANRVHSNWTMEDHLQVLYGRFPWLHIVFTKPQGVSFKKTFPFIKVSLLTTYNDVEFPEGVEPLDYFKKYRDVLPEKLKSQLGPMLKIKDKQIVWQDKYAHELVMACYRRIPDKCPTPDAKSWRAQAWQNCVKSHRYERTFALGMLQEARDLGVMSAMEILHLRKAAGLELKKKNEGAFQFWRAVVSFGGRCVYAEGAGIVCHYYFEKALTSYLVSNPNDAQVAHYLRAQPWIKNALDSFFDVNEAVFNSPDVVALRKSGLLNRD